MIKTELLSKEPFPFPHDEAWNELHITTKGNKIIRFYVNNQIWDSSTDFKRYILNNADALEIDVKNISFAALYRCNNKNENTLVESYAFH